MYAYIENGEVKRIGNLPKVWQMKNGTTVSGFHLFANQTEADEDGKTGAERLREEGWLPLVDEKPEYDEETQYLTNPTYEIGENEVVRRYEIADIPVEEEVSQGLSAEDRIEQLEAQNLANMFAMVEMYEDKMKLEERNVATMLALTELYEMIGG